VNVLIDYGPDFRLQYLSAKVRHIDYALLTHAHADHCHGLVDLLSLSTTRHLELFVTQPVFDELVVRCPEMLNDHFNCNFNVFDGPFEIAGVRVVPIPVMHGILKISGFRFGSAAYITDGSSIPPESYALLAGVRQLVINGLRKELHPTHFSFGQTLDEIEKIQPEKAFVTHVSHELTHVGMQQFFDDGKKGRPRIEGTQIEPCYDGLEFEISLAG
jgi:phosphoribosyl 1,2-cyclic phosphate phosphodiesterase